MKFCTKCDNMMYNIEERSGSAFLKCRQCEYEEPITKENPVVYEHDLLQDTSIPYYPNNEVYYDKLLDKIKDKFDVISHTNTHHPGFPLGMGYNYWDSLFVEKN